MRAPLRTLPRTIWALGWVSLFMDGSSELIHSLLPVFLSTALGASMVTIGLLEGIAEATASIVKVFSGVLSDRFRSRKPLLVLGYGLAALTKPVFPLATSVGQVFAARFIDRIGKGIRGAPRDALVADITPQAVRGAAYGLRQALDSVGAFIGPLLALLCMAWLADDLRSVLWIGAIPAFVAVAWLVAGVKEPRREHALVAGGARLLLTGTARLGATYWRVVALGAVFTLARFSEAFLILRAQNTGMRVGLVPVVMIVMNLVYSAASYPAGAAADRFSRRRMLLAGLSVLILSDLVLAAASAPWIVLGGAALWGLHLALTQGLFSKLVADAAPADLRGTAFGIFNLISGAALLCASLMAGALWELAGAPAMFLTGGGLALLAALGIMISRPSASHTSENPQHVP